MENLNYSRVSLEPFNTSTISTKASNYFYDHLDRRYENFYLWSRFILTLFCYPLVCLIGLVGNSLSAIVLCRKKMKNSTNFFLLALSLSDSIKLANDLLFSIVITLTYCEGMTVYWIYYVLFPYAHYVSSMSLCVTAWLTVSVAVERYVMVSNQIFFPYYNFKKLFFLVGIEVYSNTQQS